jgi:hypothetical protein
MEKKETESSYSTEEDYSYESGEGDSDDSSSSEEPRLKYFRVMAGVAELTKRDAISCLTLHEKFIVVGTYSGGVHVMDVSGKNS